MVILKDIEVCDVVYVVFIEGFVNFDDEVVFFECICDIWFLVY